MTSVPNSPPRNFPTSGFVSIDTRRKIEEETLPSYAAEDYYPAYIGEVFESRYQIVGKLGFGVNSKIPQSGSAEILGKGSNRSNKIVSDLHRDHRYLTLKLCVRTKENGQHREITIHEHLKSQHIQHPGEGLVRSILELFEVTGPNGRHKYLLYEPLGLSFAEAARLLPENRFPKELVQRSIHLLLAGLAYLHDCGVVHTGKFLLCTLDPVES
jgi:serine/threonine protein kinase